MSIMKTVSGCLLALALVLVTPARAVAEEAPRATAEAEAAERQARGQVAAKAFMLGHYQEALDTYLDLYLKSNGRPEYLRNIGRCQQKLNQYELAIGSLKDYLQRSKRVTADDRREVQGFIAEIEAAKASSAERANPAPANSGPMAAPAPTGKIAVVPAPSVVSPTTAPSPPTAAPSVAASPPSAEATGAASGSPNLSPSPTPAPPAPSPLLVMQPQQPPPSKSAGTGALKVGGIVALAAAGALAVGGTVMLLSARSSYESAKGAGCPSNASVDCGSKANSVASSNKVSQILYVGAAIAAVAGGTMLFIAPGPTGATQVGLTTRIVF